MITLKKQKKASSVLATSLDGSRLEGLVLRRNNGSVVVQQAFFASLSLDPVTNDAELVGREIRKQLDQVSIREKRCVVGIPLSWALTSQVKIPDMPPEDIPSFLELEAERTVPYAPDALLITHSRIKSSSGEEFATLIAVPRDHVVRLESALKAARLRPVSFSLGITALQRPAVAASDGVLALIVGETGVALQVCAGGGVAAIRTLEGVMENEGGHRQIYADAVAREIRITLGQMPAEFRQGIRQVNIFGERRLAARLAEEIEPRLNALGFKVRYVTDYSADAFGVKTPADAEVSAPFSLAALHLIGHGTGFEFLPPKVSALQQFTARYSSRKLVTAGVALGAAALLVGLAFAIQQWQLSSLRNRWIAMSGEVHDLDNLQQQIRRFRPWYDESVRTLSILRRVTEAFPEDGVVSAKTVEIRESSNVTCSGNASDNQALLRTQERLIKTREISDLKVEQIRGGKQMQFTFSFHWGERQQP